MNNVSNAVLSCTQLSKTYHEGHLNVAVLKSITLTVQKGERIAIIGASGSGKSTLLHLLGGLDTPNTGQVTVAGEDLTYATDEIRCKIRNRYLGFVYQFHHLLPEFTVLENVCMPLLIRGAHPDDAAAKALSILEKVGMAQRTDHKLAELSGGERQRTAIARALVTDPLCVLADEPTGNLDQHTAERVYDVMLELNRALRTSFIVVTHDPQLAARMDRTYQLKEGTLTT